MSIPFEQILERVQQQSLPHLHQLVSLVGRYYPTHAQRILDAAVANLSIPTDVDGFEPTEGRLAAVFDALLCLTELAQHSVPARVPRAGASPAAIPIDFTSADVAEKYLFWTLRLLGVPASPTSPNPALQQISSKLRLSFYERATEFLHTVFRVPSVFYKAFPSRLKPTVLDAVIAVWVSFPNAEPPIYAYGSRGPRPPGEPWVDPSTVFVSWFGEKEPKAFAEAVVAGRLCPVEVFVQRTTARMQALSRLSGLQHLSHLPPTTNESENFSMLTKTMSALVQNNERVREVYAKEGVSGAYIGVLSELAERMERTSNGEIGELSVPNNLPQWFELVDSFINLSHTIAYDATRSPISIIKEVQSLVSNGIIRILAVMKRHRPQERQTKWDIIWIAVSRYCFYLEVAPGLSRDGMDHLDSTLPDALAKREYPRDPNSVYQRPGADEPTNPRDVDISRDLVCLGMVAQFVEKRHRVRLCDNLNHYARLGVYEESKTQGEHTCSKCHSVVYCSAACQQEDWRAFHRQECSKMAKAYTNAKNADQIYSYENRTFQATVLRHSWESLLPDKDRKRGAIPYSEGRNGVITPDLFQPDASTITPPTEYLGTRIEGVPPYLRPRLLEYFRIFIETNGDYSGSDQTKVKAQNRRILARSFRFGDQDVNVVMLLHRVKYFEFKGKDAQETAKKCTKYKDRGPEAESDYLVQGVMHFMSPAEAWPTVRDRMADMFARMWM